MSFFKIFHAEPEEKPYLGKEGRFRKFDDDTPVFSHTVIENGKEKSVLTKDLSPEGHMRPHSMLVEHKLEYGSLDNRKRWSVQPEQERAKTLPKLDLDEELRTKYGVTFHLPPQRESSKSKLSRKVVPALRVRSNKTDVPIKAKPKVHKIGSTVQQGQESLPPVKFTIQQIEDQETKRQNELLRERRHSSATIELSNQQPRESETFVSRLELDLKNVQKQRRNSGGRRLRDIKRKDNVDFKRSSSTPSSPRLAERGDEQRRSMRIYTSYSDVDGTTTISSCEVVSPEEKPRLSRHLDFLKNSLRKRARLPSHDRRMETDTETEMETIETIETKTEVTKEDSIKIIDLDHELKSGHIENGDEGGEKDVSEEKEVEEKKEMQENGTIEAAVEAGKGTVIDDIDTNKKDESNEGMKIEQTESEDHSQEEHNKLEQNQTNEKSDSGVSSEPNSPTGQVNFSDRVRPKSFCPGPMLQSSPKILKHDASDRARPKSSVSFTSDDTISNLSYNSFTAMAIERERAKLKTNGSLSPESCRLVCTEAEIHSLTEGSTLLSTDSNETYKQGHTVVVAIDFGTTYSGYAFSYLQDPRNIHVMRKWDQGDPGVINQKTPTTLLLDPDGKFDSFGFAARDKYHNLIPCEAEKWLYFEKFKMMLHHDEGLNPTTTIRANNGSLWPALTIFSHALRFFKDHALRELSEQSAMRILNEDVRWVVTVPAIWKQPAKQFMRLAAYEAGIASPELHDQLLIALEPEAASIYCRALKLYQLAPEKPVECNKRISLALSPRRRDSSFNLDEEPGLEFTIAPSSPFPHYKAADSVDLAVGGTPYMVVDCGGGTVDITVHQLSQLDGKLKELATAVGSAHGSIDVDAEFERLLTRIFSEEFVNLFKENRPAGYVDLMIAFEARKRSASPFQDSSFNISIPFSFIDYYKKFKRRNFGTIPRRSLNSLQRRSFSVQDGAIAMETAVRKNKVKGVSWLSQLGMLRLSSEVMHELFEPALVEICAAIRRVLDMQDAKAVQYMFLVGGFAESPILQKRVRAEFETEVKVIIPQGTALSILRGAVMYGLDPSVITHRKSRLTYGVAVLNRFDPAKHPQSKRVQIGEYTWCADVFDKFVRINQSVGLGDSVIREYSPAKTGQKMCVFNVFCTDRESVRFVTDRGVSRCGTMTLVLPVTEAGVHRRKVQMRMSFGDTEIKVTAVDLSTGQSANANVNFLSV